MFQQKMREKNHFYPPPDSRKKTQPYHGKCKTPLLWRGTTRFAAHILGVGLESLKLQCLVEKQVASFENCVTFFQEWNGTDITILIFFFGGVGVIVWWLSKHISDKILFELVGDGWWFSEGHCLSFEEWIPQTATFGRTKSELCSKAHAFQYPFVKFVGCMWYAVGLQLDILYGTFLPVWSLTNMPNQTMTIYKSYNKTIKTVAWGWGGLMGSNPCCWWFRNLAVAAGETPKLLAEFLPSTGCCDMAVSLVSYTVWPKWCWTCWTETPSA